MKTHNIITKSPTEHRYDYFNQELFQELQLPEIVQKGYLQSSDDLLRRIAKFNGLQSFAPNELKHTDLEQIVANRNGNIHALGESFHFVRKAIQKNYEFRDPVPIIDTMFAALSPLIPANSHYAAKFLQTICDFMSKDKRSQPNMKLFFEHILPEVTSEYQASIGNISKYNGKSPQYTQQKLRLDSAYQLLLEGVTTYMQNAIKLDQSSIEGFHDYRRRNNLRLQTLAKQVR